MPKPLRLSACSLILSEINLINLSRRHLSIHIISSLMHRSYKFRSI